MEELKKEFEDRRIDTVNDTITQNVTLLDILLADLRDNVTESKDYEAVKRIMGLTYCVINSLQGDIEYLENELNARSRELICVKDSYQELLGITMPIVSDMDDLKVRLERNGLLSKELDEFLSTMDKFENETVWGVGEYFNMV